MEREMEHDVNVAGHRLPRLLVQLMVQGRWELRDKSALGKLCGYTEIYSHLYQVWQMELETRAVQRERDGLGRVDARYVPGDIDPANVVVFGDNGCDACIALDYRTAPPRVVHLKWDSEGSLWVEIAKTFEEFATAIGL